MDTWQVSLQVKWGVWKWDWKGSEECALCATWQREVCWALLEPTTDTLNPFLQSNLHSNSLNGSFLSAKICVKNVPCGNDLMYVSGLYMQVQRELTVTIERGKILNCLLDELCALAYVAWLHVGLYLYVSHHCHLFSSVLMYSENKRSLHIQGGVKLIICNWH